MFFPENRWVWKHRRCALGLVSWKTSLMEHFWDMLICALSLAETGEAGLQATERQLWQISNKGGTVVGLKPIITEESWHQSSQLQLIAGSLGICGRSSLFHPYVCVCARVHVHTWKPDVRFAAILWVVVTLCLETDLKSLLTLGLPSRLSWLESGPQESTWPRLARAGIIST